MLMDFVLEPLDCPVHYESLNTQPARSTPTGVKKAVQCLVSNCTTDHVVKLGAYIHRVLIFNGCLLSSPNFMVCCVQC